MKFLKLVTRLKGQISKMSVYTQVLNPMTGQSEWQFQTENYDYHQEIARAAFADMLHDTERNQKYYFALEKAIKKLHQSGKKANVLDIGTGTGLLSMMAVKCGADSVTACEAFMPMANCAAKIIQANGMADKIHLIKKRSTEITLGSDSDSNMNERCNVLVTEVFDTELIGEGAIDIFNHAHANLLTDDCVVIPSFSTVYAQIVESPTLHAFNKPKLLANLDGEVLLKTPGIIQNCTGEASVHDMQLSQLKSNDFKVLSEPIEIFSFDFNSKNPIKKDETSIKKVDVIREGHSQAVLFWWDLKMDQEGEILLSCAPYWAHPDFEKNSKNNEPAVSPLQNCIPWRDHWIQGVYYLPKPVMLNQNYVYLHANHDEYSYWFNLTLTNENVKFPSPSCSCGFHLAYSRNRIAQINSSLRNKKYLSILEEEIDKNAVVISLSEGSLLGLSTIAMGAKALYCFEPNRISRKTMELYVEENNLKNVKMIESIDELKNYEEITHVISEPYFSTTILPWDNFYYGILLDKLREKLKKDVRYLPVKANIRCIPVEFIDLQKIRAPIGTCEGFNMKIFDGFINDSLERADANIEAQPLWEYPCKALSEPYSILSVDFSDFSKTIKTNGLIPIEHEGNCNGIVCWVDWKLGDNDSLKSVYSTGPVHAVKVGKFIEWDIFTRQGVHLLPQMTAVNCNNNVEFETNFQPKKGELLITFNVK